MQSLDVSQRSTRERWDIFFVNNFDMFRLYAVHVREIYDEKCRVLCWINRSQMIILVLTIDVWPFLVKVFARRHDIACALFSVRPEWKLGEFYLQFFILFVACLEGEFYELKITCLHVRFNGNIQLVKMVLSLRLPSFHAVETRINYRFLSHCVWRFESRCN